MTKRGEVRAWLERVAFVETDECIEFPFAKSKRGYGHVKRGGRNVRASHVVMALRSIERPPGAEILHSCDNPPCVNHRHMRWGTRAVNLQEAWDRDLRAPEITCTVEGCDVKHRGESLCPKHRQKVISRRHYLKTSIDLG